MNSKKAITLLVLATLILSFVPIVPAQAVAITTPVHGAGAKGDTIVVEGTGVVAGKTVKLYWDLVQAWDGEAGLLNSSKAKSSGDWEIWFDVPEATNGTHYIWIEDTQTLDTDKNPFDVYSKVTLSSTSGLKDDKVTVKGYGFSSEVDVGLAFNDTGAVAVHDAAELAADGTTLEWDGTLSESPIEPGTVVFSNSTAAYDVTDDGQGNLECAHAIFVDGSINYVTGEYTIEFTQTLKATGADFDADYEAFVDAANNVKIFSKTVETNDKGSFTKEVTIPDYTTGNYNVTVIDAKGVWGEKEFALGPVITLSKSSGPVGTVVEISGRGFTADEYVVEIDFAGVKAYNLTNEQVGTKGTFDVEFVVPSVNDEDEYEVTVTVNDDAGGADTTATADFEVTGLPSIELTPEYGGVNDLIGISGYNFSQISGTEVTVNFTAAGKDDVKAGTFKTDSDGEFSGTFRVPAAASQIWSVNASIEDHMINTTTNFRVGIVLALVAPEVGAHGAKVTLSGVGFTDNEAWNATLDDELIAEGDADADGVFTETFYVPNIDPGVYTIYILDIDSDITVMADFEVTDETYLEIDPIQAANGYNITIFGYNFAEDNDADVTFTLWNETDEWEITNDVYNYSSGLDEQTKTAFEKDEDAGTFVAWWEVYDDETLDLGTYWLNVTDNEEIFAQIQIDVVEEVVAVSPKKSTYSIGETVAFNIRSTFEQNGAYIEIYDPDGNLYWQTDAINTWLSVGYEKVVPFYSQVSGANPMVLISDAPLGTWTWEMYDVDDDLLEEGTFVVQEAAADVIGEQVADLNNQITDLASQLTDVTAEFDDVKSDIADVAAIAEQAVTAAQQAAEAVETVAQTANTASQAASDAAEAANAARDAANGLTTLVYGAIGAALVAALAAIVSLMQISRRIAG